MPRSVDNTDVSIRELPDRKWGIELEVIRDLDRDVMARVCRKALKDAGFRSRKVMVESYTHDGPQNVIWKWKPDTSCGYELTSPVMSGWEGLRELRVIMDAVDKWATENNSRLVNRNCGVHIHVDSRDLTWKDIRNLSISMKIWEPIFFAMNPHSRKDNRHCRAIDFSAKRMKDAINTDQVHDVWTSYENNSNGRSARYHGFNLDPWWRRGSVEYRYFSGTWAFEKAVAALMMALLTTQAVKNKGSVRIPDTQLAQGFDGQWSTAGTIGFEEYSEKFFRDFLVLRSGECPAFSEFKKFVKSRISMFYNNDGTQKQYRG